MRRSAAEILTLLERNAQVIRSHGVRRLGLFGSAARGTAEEESDLDFVVEFERKSFDACGGRHTMTLDVRNALASTFAEHLKSGFRLHHGAATTELELVEVSDGSTRRQVSFSLVFRGPHQPLLPQQIYAFEHDRLGRFDLFIVPIRRDVHGLYYEAIVNRVVTTDASTNERH